MDCTMMMLNIIKSQKYESKTLLSHYEYPLGLLYATYMVSINQKSKRIR